MNEFVTWDMLTGYAGAALAVTVLTQFIKQLPYMDRVNSQIISYAIAVIVMLAAQYFTGTFTPASAVLCIINGAIVALTSNGVYDAVTTTKEYIHEEK